MWVPLARGACIYGAHMTRNITANNTTNTCAFPQHPPPPEKNKKSNKCHPTQSRGSETARQTNKQSFGLRRESSTHKMSLSLIVWAFLMLPAISLVILLPCEWNVLCSFQSNCDFFARANVGSLAAWKKKQGTQQHHRLQGWPVPSFPPNPHNWVLSRSLEIRTNDYYSAIGFQLWAQEGGGAAGGEKRGELCGPWGVGGWASSHIKVYRRPLALGGFVESSCILTHILARGQVTLLDYYQRGRRFGALAQLARFLVPALSPLERIRLRTRTY